MDRHDYPTSDYGITRRIVNAYCEMVQETIDKDYEPYLLTIMFKERASKRRDFEGAGEYQ